MSKDRVNRFWNWARDADTGERTLYLDGPIASETWLGDEITPALFKADLYAEQGDVTIYLNSLGGDVWAASQIYTMLLEYPYQVTIKIDGVAASAASVVAMAGSTVLMSPVAGMLIHNPQTIAIGDAEEMRRTEAMLGEVKESLINAYQLKTGLSRTVLSHMLSDETYMNAYKAIELHFADGILTDDKRRAPTETPQAYSLAAVTNSLNDRIRAAIKPPDPPPPPPEPTGTPAETLLKRLNLLLDDK